jgi:hypothetical protein
MDIDFFSGCKALLMSKVFEPHREKESDSPRLILLQFGFLANIFVISHQLLTLPVSYRLYECLLAPLLRSQVSQIRVAMAHRAGHLCF